MALSKPRAFSLLALVLSLAVHASTAQADDVTADEILEKSRRASALGLVGAKAEIKLVVDNGKGALKERKLTASAIQLPSEVRRLVRFLEPADVRGVAVLVIEKGGQSDRMLYLPAQKRVRRVSGKQGGQSFQETDFSYADLDLAGGQGDKHKREADATVEGNPCWVLTTTPAADSPYGRIVTYVHQKTAVPLQILFHDKSDVLVKRLKANKVKQVDGRWYAVESVMETPAKGSKTTLTVASLDTKASLSADDFTEQALERQ